MVNRVQILLLQPEYNAMLKMATDDLRSIPDEIHFILQEEMKRRGLLEVGNNPNIPVIEGANHEQ